MRAFKYRADADLEFDHALTAQEHVLMKRVLAVPLFIVGPAIWWIARNGPTTFALTGIETCSDSEEEARQEVGEVLADRVTRDAHMPVRVLVGATVEIGLCQ
jgi:hypothetical protein